MRICLKCKAEDATDSGHCYLCGSETEDYGATNRGAQAETTVYAGRTEPFIDDMVAAAMRKASDRPTWENLQNLVEVVRRDTLAEFGK